MGDYPTVLSTFGITEIVPVKVSEVPSDVHITSSKVNTLTPS